MRVLPGDVVILNDGQTVTVEQAAQFDSIFMYRDSAGRTAWTDDSLVAWNKTEVEFASLDSELMQDYT